MESHTTTSEYRRRLRTPPVADMSAGSLKKLSVQTRPCPQAAGLSGASLRSHAANAAGLSDMVANVVEWTSNCWDDDCSRRVFRGGSWFTNANALRPSTHNSDPATRRADGLGFRVANTLD